MAAGRTYAGVSAEERLARRRERLLDAGLELFGTRPYDEVSVADLIALAGVTRRAFYETFADREALLLAVHARLFEQQMGRMAAVAGEDLQRPATLEATERTLRAQVAWYEEDTRRARVQFVAVVGVSPGLEQMRREHFRLLAETFATWAGERAGPTPAARRRAMITFFGAFSELLIDWLWAQDDTLEELVSELVTFLRMRFFAS